MRARIVAAALSAVVLAVTVFGLPLAILVQRMVVADERGELERLALGAAVEVSPSYRSGDPIELPDTEPGVDLAVYDPQGAHVTGPGPERLDDALRGALDGTVVEGGDSSLDVAVPVSSGERVIAVVRASSPSSVVDHRVWLLWAAMVGMGLVAAGAAWMLARRQSLLLVRPLTALENVSRELGDGNFGARAEMSGVPEIDDAGAALNRTAERLAALIARQRSFTSDASHQLRTPLTRLRLELEDGLSGDRGRLEEAAREALASADALSVTIDDVLEVARGEGSSVSFEVDTLLTTVRDSWHGTLAAADRPLRITSEPGLRVAASLAATRQILHTLLDNAYWHGRGVVEVRCRVVGGAVAIDVLDEGGPVSLTLPKAADGEEADPRLAADPGALGLRLARSLAEAEGGRLGLTREGARTRFTVFLPAEPA
ncbi:MAG: HAMP domain-containing histidine kinase [Nocardioidaceae bacterium]|nr:HAMP domain-containing histidine kinase [Nocardioidaceae bacterium]